MVTLSLEDSHQKDLIKQALLELFQDRRDLFMDLFDELIEDIALANAMQEAERGDMVSKEEIMAALVE
jgi:hypothetical protein